MEGVAHLVPVGSPEVGRAIATATRERMIESRTRIVGCDGMRIWKSRD